jgi:hypothetical protein
MKKLMVAGFILGACLAMTLPASAREGYYGGGHYGGGHFRGGIAIIPSFGFGWNDPYFYGPYGLYGPYEVYPSVYSNKGEVQLKTNVKDADVYINGAFSGKAGKLKSMWLRPDTYSIEVRAPGATPYSQRVYVVPGKTIKLEAYFSTMHKS